MVGECIAFPKVIGGDDSPLIPEGIYEMAYQYHVTWKFMGRQPKVVIYFCIIELGDYFEIVLPAYYNVIKHVGKCGKSGGFKAAKKSYLVRDYCSALPEYPLPRLDRIPLSNLASVVVRGTVVTVKKGLDQRDIPEEAQYSRVATIDKL